MSGVELWLRKGDVSWRFCIYGKGRRAYPATVRTDGSRVIRSTKQFHQTSEEREGSEDRDGDAGDEEDGEFGNVGVEPQPIQNGDGGQEGVEEDEAQRDGCAEFVLGRRIGDRWEMG